MKPVVVEAVATWGLRLQASNAAGKNQRTQSGAGGGEGHLWRAANMPAVGRYKKREAPLEMPPVSVGKSTFTQRLRRSNC